MTTSRRNSPITVAVACALALGFVSNTAVAFEDASQRALVTSQGQQVIKSGFGLCWHSGFGPAPVSTAECDPNFAPPRVAPVVQRVEPAPKPAPIVAIAPPPPPPAPVHKQMIERVTLDADTLFDFDKAVLRAEGRAALNAFVGKLKDITPQSITAIGHTDRLGSDKYNQDLSERRAAAVRTYLLEHGVPSSQLHSEGKGEKQPVTKAADCQGGKSAKLIACLQPDRRVDVEVLGTRTVR